MHRALLLAALLSASCPLPAAEPPPFLARLDAGWAAGQPERVLLTALITGKLRVVRGCFALAGDAPVLLVTEPGVRAERVGGRWALREGDGPPVRVGEPLNAGGGFSSRPPEGLLAAVPPRCRWGRYAAVHGIGGSPARN